MKSSTQTERASRGVIQLSAQEFGRSRLGCPIEVFLPARLEQGSLLILAGQHGDEPETTALLSSALRTIPAEHLGAAVVLAMNPDGLLRGTRGNAAGVDLNRNFPVANWGVGEIAYRWTSENPRDVRLSAGEAPASEPETMAIMRLIEKLRPRCIISIHAPLACVDDPLASPMGKWLSRETGLPLVPDVGYPTPGSFGTFATQQGLHVITWELPHWPIETLRLKFDPLLVSLLRKDFDVS